MSDITLTAGIRQNLLSLQQTSADLTTTQEQLATGKKVNTAVRKSDLLFHLAIADQPRQRPQRAARPDRPGAADAQRGQQRPHRPDQPARTGAVDRAAGAAGDHGHGDLQHGGHHRDHGHRRRHDAGHRHGDRRQRAGTASTASMQSTATLNAAGIGQLAAGDTLTFQLGSGTTVTATFGTSDDASDQYVQHRCRPDLGSEHRHRRQRQPEHRSVRDLRRRWRRHRDQQRRHSTTSRSATPLRGALTRELRRQPAHSSRHALTVSDGTHSSSYYYVAIALPAGARRRRRRRRRLQHRRQSRQLRQQRGGNTRTPRSRRALPAPATVTSRCLRAGAVTVGGTIGANAGLRHFRCERQLQRDIVGSSLPAARCPSRSARTRRIRSRSAPVPARSRPRRN